MPFTPDVNFSTCTPACLTVVEVLSETSSQLATIRSSVWRHEQELAKIQREATKSGLIPLSVKQLTTNSVHAVVNGVEHAPLLDSQQIGKPCGDTAIEYEASFKQKHQHIAFAPDTRPAAPDSQSARSFHCILKELAEVYELMESGCANVPSKAKALMPQKSVSREHMELTLSTASEMDKDCNGVAQQCSSNFIPASGSNGSHSAGRETSPTSPAMPQFRPLLSGETSGCEESVAPPRLSRISMQWKDLESVAVPLSPDSGRKLDKLQEFKVKEKHLNSITHSKIMAFIASDRFGLLTAFFIIANSIFIGVQVNYSVHREFHRLDGQPTGRKLRIWLFGDIAFCSIFTIELLCRMLRDKWLFVVGRERLWNLFDVVVVAASLSDILTDLVGADQNWGLGVLRTLRMVRIVRVLRVGSSIQVVMTMKAMIYGLVCSANSFAAALLLLTGFIYIFGLIFMSAVLRYLTSLDANQNPQGEREQPSWRDSVGQLKKHFGTFSQTVWSLNLATTGGDDWYAFADSLEHVGVFYKVLFAFYIFCVLMGLLNVLSGTFVSAAMQSSAMDRQLMTEHTIRSREAVVREIVGLFVEADVDGSGTISWAEFSDFMHDERVKAYLMALDLDMSSAKKVFTLLCTDSSGELALEEFVGGCIRLRGSAKMVDIAILEASVRAMLHELFKSIKHLWKSHTSTQSKLFRLATNQDRNDDDALPKC